MLLGGEDFCCLEYFDFSEESVALGKDLAAAGGSDAQTGTFLAAKFPEGLVLSVRDVPMSLTPQPTFQQRRLLTAVPTRKPDRCSSSSLHGIYEGNLPPWFFFPTSDKPRAPTSQKAKLLSCQHGCGGWQGNPGRAWCVYTLSLSVSPQSH